MCLEEREREKNLSRIFENNGQDSNLRPPDPRYGALSTRPEDFEKLPVIYDPTDIWILMFHSGQQ